MYSQLHRATRFATRSGISHADDSEALLTLLPPGVLCFNNHLLYLLRLITPFLFFV